jgi:TonB family protein
LSGIFVSYRRSDSQGEAGRLFDDLVKHFDEQTVFMDVSAIEAGRDFRKAIEEGVTKCGVLLVVMGPEWLSAKNETGARRLDDPADFVRIETASALRRDIPVIPVLVRGASMPTAEQLPEDLKELAYRNCIELTHARWRSDIQLLLEALRRLDAASQSDGSAGFNPISNSSLKLVTAAPRNSASYLATNAPKPKAKDEDPSSFEPAVIERVTRELALHIGPIAAIVVNRAASHCASVEDLYRTVAEEIDSKTAREKFLNHAAIPTAPFPETARTATPPTPSPDGSALVQRNDEQFRTAPLVPSAHSPNRWKFSLIAIGGMLVLAIVVAAHFARSGEENPSPAVHDKPQESRVEAASTPTESMSSGMEAKPAAVEAKPSAASEIPTKGAEAKPKQIVHLSPEAAHSLLITEIAPAYPPLARQAHIQGMVVIDADISREGNVENLKATSGHPLLIPSAIDAVKKWKYKPYVINGEATPVNTRISVNFTLTGG